MGETKEVECQFDPWQEFVPTLKGAVHVNGGKSGNNMFLERPNGAFSGVGTMVMRWDQLYLQRIAEMCFLTAFDHLLSITFNLG